MSEFNHETLEILSNGEPFFIDTITTPKLTGGKGNPQQGRVKCETIGAVVKVFSTGHSYQDEVNDRLTGEGKPADFVSQPRKWGTRIQGTPFIVHNDKYYMEVVLVSGGSRRFLLDGVPVPMESVQGLPVAAEPDQDGLTDKVIVRTYALDSIVAIYRKDKTFYTKEGV